MITEVKVPKLDANMEEVTITGWFRKEGEKTGKGERLVELTTDKASFEFESPAAGIVRKILAPEKSIVPVGYILALVGEASDPLPDVSAVNRELLAKHRPKKTPRPPATPVATGVPPGVSTIPKATPAARRLAKEQGIDLDVVRRTTGADTVTEEVIRKYLEGRS
ncbi:MAG: hypothetical protein C0404_08080 [Verrucomicrobia bacterium]|nr:hypothetical protein [Verrucomicrobiota bacterium]